MPLSLASPHTRLPKWALSVSLRLARAARDSRSRAACVGREGARREQAQRGWAGGRPWGWGCA